jgi:hypothetical protein
VIDPETPGDPEMSDPRDREYYEAPKSGTMRWLTIVTWVAVIILLTWALTMCVTAPADAGLRCKGDVCVLQREWATSAVVQSSRTGRTAKPARKSGQN